MESDLDRLNRRTWPGLWPRLTLWVAISYVVNWLHALNRPRILSALPYDSLADLYVRITTIAIVTFTAVGLGSLVACYYYALRNRRTYTALTELGFAMRSIFAAIFAAVAFALALHINAGGWAGE